MSNDVSFFIWYTADAVMHGNGDGYGDGDGYGYGKGYGNING